MKATRQLHDRGQGLRDDNIPRGAQDDGARRRYIDECSSTGLTSKSTMGDRAGAGRRA